MSSVDVLASEACPKRIWRVLAGLPLPDHAAPPRAECWNAALEDHTARLVSTGAPTMTKCAIPVANATQTTLTKLLTYARSAYAKPAFVIVKTTPTR
jgi:hypothetical protein